MNNIISVSKLNKYIKQLLSNDAVLSGVCVKGEISNFKHHSSGHMYFTLKDENSLIKCVMFRSQNSKLKFTPKDGMKIIATGYISVYEQGGVYQLYPQHLVPDGIGDLHQAFEKLKEKLTKDGLFDVKYKKPIPLLPDCIGIVTSPTGSVIRDILNVTFRRFPNMKIKLIPSSVQGEGAALQIARGIRKFNELKNVDVIIIARGGGSLEEIWPFNEEIVSKSIFESNIPVISAVGHETDFSIADFTADMRAPTPSAAAEIAVPEKDILYSTVLNMQNRLSNGLKNQLEISKSRIDTIIASYTFKHPLDRINQLRISLDNKTKDLNNAVYSEYEKRFNEFSMLTKKLDMLSPLSVISKGYGLVEDEKGKIITSITDVKKDDIVNIVIKDGTLNCKIENVTGGKKIEK